MEKLINKQDMDEQTAQIKGYVDDRIDSAICNVVPAFSPNSTYDVGDVVYHNGNFYVCNTQITIPGNWDSSKWTQITLSEELNSLLNNKQDALVNQQNIKSINGNSLLGSGDMEIKTHPEFPSSWTTNATMADLFTDIENDPNAIVGMTYLGEVTCSDLPFSGNAEIIINIMNDTGINYGNNGSKIILATLTSSNVAPYYWQYTYGNGHDSGWQTFISNDNSFPEFSDQSTYSVNDVVTHEGLFYQCHTAVTVAGSWSGATNWNRVSLRYLFNSKQDTLSIASSTTAGIIKVSFNPQTTIPQNTTITTGRTYAVQLYNNDQAVVNVPWKEYVKTGASDPTSATVGEVGSFYFNTTSGNSFQCISKTAQGTVPETYTYTWSAFGGSQGSQLYRHIIYANNGTVDTGTIEIISTRSTQYDFVSLVDYLYNSGYIDISHGKLYYFKNSITNMLYMGVCYVNSLSDTYITTAYYDPNGIQGSAISDTDTITDTVTPV